MKKEGYDIKKIKKICNTCNKNTDKKKFRKGAAICNPCDYLKRRAKTQKFNPIDPNCKDCGKLREPVAYYGRRCYTCYKIYRNKNGREKRAKNKMNKPPTKKERKIIKKKLFREFKEYTGVLSIMIQC